MKVTVTKAINGYVVHFFENQTTHAPFDETHIAKDGDELVTIIEKAEKDIQYIADMENQDSE